MGKINRWMRWRVRFRRALAPLRPVTDLLQGPGEGERTRGFGLIEVAIAMAASAVIFSAIYSTVTAASESDHGLRVRVDLQLEASRVLLEITDILKSSEPLEVWEDGASTPAIYANAAALSRARTPEEGQGSSQEIALRSGSEIRALVIVPGPDGNEVHLRRYDTAGTFLGTRVIGRHVERITFEKSAASILVNAWFRRVVDRKPYTVRQTRSADRPTR